MISCTIAHLEIPEMGYSVLTVSFQVMPAYHAESPVKLPKSSLPPSVDHRALPSEVIGTGRQKSE
jgi:hypothetical protein